MKKFMSSIGLVLIMIAVGGSIFTPAATANAAAHNIWFRWSSSNNGSVIMGYTATCNVYRQITSVEMYPRYNALLGSWRWGAINGTEERFVATHVKPDLVNHGGSTLYIDFDCDNDEIILDRYYVNITPNPNDPNSPIVTWDSTVRIP